MGMRERLRATTSTVVRARARGRRGVIIASIAGLVATSLAGTSVGPASADLYSEKLDLVFLMDGSGSIDSSDWIMQKQGYIEALDDLTTFPRDGSISISLVQWSYDGTAGSTRVEVPPTVLTSETVVDDISSEIDGIAQIGYSTNPGDAIIRGTDLLLNQGRPDADWSLCMSTDGAINSGVDIASAVSYAMSNSVDRYGVLAIEDGFFDEAAAYAAYADHVFGDGQVTVARSTAEFATLISGCVNPTLLLEAVEVTQGVQTPMNDVQLVEGRDTIVRAYVRTYGVGNTARTSGRLRGYRNGVEVAESPLAPLNADQSIYVTDDALARRSDRDATLNFRLPASWTTGEIEMRVEMGGGTGCDLTEYVRWTINCGTLVDFDASRPDLNLGMVEVSWDNMTGADATYTDAVTMSQRSEAMFPIADFNMKPFALEVADGWWDDKTWFPEVGEYINVLSDLEALTFFYNTVAQDDAVMQGMLPGTHPTAGSPTGMAMQNASAAWLDYARGTLDGGRLRNVFPHELGHNLGLWHAVDSHDVGWFTKSGYCGEVAPKWADDHTPFSVINGEMRPVLGSMGVPDREVWGVDENTFELDEDLAVSAPHDVYALMGYCDNGDDSLQGTWLSKWDWDRLRQGRLDPAIGAGAPGGALSGADGIYVAGGWDPASDRGVLTQVLPTNQTRPGDPESGVQVRAYAADGSVLGTAWALTPDPGAAAHGEGADVQSGIKFAATLALDPARVVRLDLVVAGDEVEVWSGSANAPVVAQPRATANPDGSVKVSWTATDADADSALRHTVFYSTDGGERFVPAAIGISTPDTILPSGSLPGGDVVVRVVSSDGLRFAAAETSVRTPNSAPQVAITSPGSEQRFSAAQRVTFKAVADDLEDEGLDGSKVTWTSDRNGFLGSGAEVAVRADQLAEGWHTVTARVADSGGAEGVATVRIFISRVPGVEPPPVKKYGWGGFTSPLSSDGAVQAGRTIPVKFTVIGEVPTEESVVSATFVRDGATYSITRDAVKDGVGSYHVNVATPKGWAGSTGTFEVRLTDGQVFTTTVAFK